MRRKSPLLPVLCCAFLSAGTATPLDDYVSKPEPDFAWRDTGKTVWPLAFGGRAHLLNVTSLAWLDESKAVVVPRNGGAKPPCGRIRWQLSCPRRSP